MRQTKTRKSLLKLFHRTSRPLSAEDLLSHLDVNKTTVYRQLESLVKSGLLRRVTFSDRKSRYELTSLGHHHHLVCNRCNSVTEITFPSQMESYFRSVSRSRNFTLTSHTLELFGLCSHCHD